MNIVAIISLAPAIESPTCRMIGAITDVISQVAFTIKISEVSTVIEEGESSCESLYPVDSEQFIIVSKKINPADKFEDGQIIEGNIHFSSNGFDSEIYLTDYKTNPSISGCKSLYWFDNDNKACGQKEFCGMYMYFGLQTFESKEQCEKALGINRLKDCPKEATVENDKCTKTLSNGRKAEIKIMPETASQNAIDKLGELNFTIELKEVGKGDDAKPVYELTGNKQGKFLGIFKIMARVSAQVDAETGDVKVIKPWWAFLASGI